MNRFINNLRRQAEENPMVALVITTTLATAATSLLNASTANRNSKAWKKEVDRRAKKS